VTSTWLTIAALALATVAIRGAGPALPGGRDLPPRAMAVVALVAPALLAALVVTQTLGDGSGIALDARMAGVATAGVAIAARSSVLVAVVAAAAVTAALRAAGVG
jgi:branched-subunit amino acid transport protein